MPAVLVAANEATLPLARKNFPAGKLPLFEVGAAFSVTQSALIELVSAMRQRAPQEVDVHMPLVLEIAAQLVATLRAAVHDVEPESRMSGSQCFQLGLVRMLATVAKPKEEVDQSLRLIGQATATPAIRPRLTNRFDT